MRIGTAGTDPAAQGRAPSRRRPPRHGRDSRLTTVPQASAPRGAPAAAAGAHRLDPAGIAALAALDPRRREPALALLLLAPFLTRGRRRGGAGGLDPVRLGDEIGRQRLDRDALLDQLLDVLEIGLLVIGAEGDGDAVIARPGGA